MTAQHRTTRSPHGFTLVELMISVSLMAVIVMVIGYVFQTSVQAISISQGNSETVLNAMAFDRILRQDIKGMERDGFLVMGRREVYDVYGSRRDRQDLLDRTARTDWMMFFIGSEQRALFDPRVISHWARVLYGHGDVSDPTSSNFSPLGTDWSLMRQIFLIMPELRTNAALIEESAGGYYQSQGLGVEWPQIGIGAGYESMWQTAVDTYTQRRLHWYWHGGQGHIHGDLACDWFYEHNSSTTGMAFFEPAHYHNWITSYSIERNRRIHAMPHCGSFRIQYAFAQDITSAGINWREPPLWHDPNRSDDPDPGATGAYPDPNFDASMPANVTHPSATIPVGKIPESLYAGRLVFAPGDPNWPVLLKVTVDAYDPLGRYEGSHPIEMLLPLR